MQYTSAANALLVLAIAPFLAAILSLLLLRERIDKVTALAIALVFAGVLIIASGSLGQGRLLGDGFALMNALTIAAYYVTLRTTGTRNMLPHLALGSILGGLLAVPFADFEPVGTTQALLIFLSGAVILPGAAGLLMLGPRYLPAPEVSMITLLEVIIGPLLVWAEGLILVYPTWWYSQPAILKGWMDRVWRPGIAFTLHDEGQRLRPALSNIRLIGVITSFGSPWWFWTFLMGAPGRKIILRGLRFCTNRRTRTFWLGLHAIDDQTDASRKRYIEKVRARIAQIPL